MTMTCVLCGAENSNDFTLAGADATISLCATCEGGQSAPVEDAPHWQCLHEAIWSTDAPVQIAAYRALTHLQHAPWARDLMEIAYLEPEVLALAQAGLTEAEPEIVHRDSNGAVLAQGDTVVLIKDLPVKGAGFTAKRGSAVRGISLVQDNAGHIEGRVEGQRIVILTEFVKKS